MNSSSFSAKTTLLLNILLWTLFAYATSANGQSCASAARFQATAQFLFSLTCSKMASANLDVLIVGGGPAGLAAALGLCRAQYTAAVFDSGVYRNRLADHMHTVPTWDHINPAEYRKAAREEILRRYNTVKFVNTTIQSIRKTDHNTFVATNLEGKEWTGKKLLLASGVTDVFPDIQGYGDCWAKGM
jgi:thioredoxin reductase